MRWRRGTSSIWRSTCILASKKINHVIPFLLQNLEEYRTPIRSKSSRGQRPLLADKFSGDLDSAAHFLGAEAARYERARHTDLHEVTESEVNLVVPEIDLGLP